MEKPRAVWSFPKKFHKNKRIGESENDKGSSKQLSPGRFVGAREGREIEKGRNKEGRKRREKSLPKSQFHHSQRTRNPKKKKLKIKKKNNCFLFFIIIIKYIFCVEEKVVLVPSSSSPTHTSKKLPHILSLSQSQSPHLSIFIFQISPRPNSFYDHQTLKKPSILGHEEGQRSRRQSRSSDAGRTRRIQAQYRQRGPVSGGPQKTMGTVRGRDPRPVEEDPGLARHLRLGRRRRTSL